MLLEHGIIQELEPEFEIPIDERYRESEEIIFGKDYESEIEAGKKIRYHRYNRSTRFRYCLTQLLTTSGDVPEEVLIRIYDHFGVDYEVEEWVNRRKMCKMLTLTRLSELEYNPDTIWSRVRKWLKTNGYALYYNRIPVILSHMGLPQCRSTNSQYEQIMNDFEILNCVFDECKLDLEIAYFPDMRYVALRLMDKHGVFPSYTIPWLNTKRKLKQVGDIVDYLFAVACRS